MTPPKKQTNAKTSPLPNSKIDTTLPQLPDSRPQFELLYNGSPIFIDMNTLLQCLKIAEYTHHIPPIDGAWWLEITKRYSVEIHLDGRIQTSP